jgi:hypothetical protein
MQKNKEIKRAGAVKHPAGKTIKSGANIKHADKAQGAQDAQMKTGRKSEDESEDFADQDGVDQDDSTKSFAADSKSRGSKLNDVKSQPSKSGSQNSRH